ncbi:MAG TPA: AAA family ATPase [Dehalococcoidia bacterium]|nr:AAA family ATPase [Dehalococcoidia bacterium]
MSLDPRSPAASPPRRVVVVGTTGAGKTTFARAVAAAIGAPHTELDALNWEPGWTPAEPAAFRARADQAAAGPAWVIDGNYGQVRDVVWARADTLVWLDYPFPLVIRRLFVRSLRRGLRREQLWNGNQERLSMQFLSRDSLFLWAVKTHWRRRREYPERLREPALAHLAVHRFRHPRAAGRWLAALRAQSESGSRSDP